MGLVRSYGGLSVSIPDCGIINPPSYCFIGFDGVAMFVVDDLPTCGHTNDSIAYRIFIVDKRENVYIYISRWGQPASSKPAVLLV